jgi:glutamate synthase (NADPH/NADH) small chain
VVAIADDAVTIKNVEVSIIDKGWDDDRVHPQVTEWHTGSTVAVIGSGPAGLAAAQQLTRAGHTVAVLERDDKPGGLLRYGIPEYKMEKSVLDRRLDQMREEGTHFKCGVEVGKDITGPALRARFDAVIVATGATVPRELDVPGRDFAGVHHAMDYLTQANRAAVGETVPDQILATGKNVVIIGGGDTGNDCLGTAIRQGAKSIMQLEHNVEPPLRRAPHEPWPTFPRILRVSPANEEGGQRVFKSSTIELTGDDDGNVTGVKIIEVVRENGVNTAVEGTEQVLEADLVLLAMGYTGPEQGLLDQLGVPVDERTRAVRNADYSTPADGIFVCGDAGRGQSLIVWAIAEGRACAAAVDQYLSGVTKLPRPVAATAQPIGH